MKTFTFRLDQVLRWRATQVEVEKTKAGAIAAELAQVRAKIQTLQAELTANATAISGTPNDGGALSAWSFWRAQTQKAIEKLRLAEQQTTGALSAQMKKLAEADRQRELVARLKSKRKSEWELEMNRELESFAAESFLGRLQSKRTGA